MAKNTPGRRTTYDILQLLSATMHRLDEWERMVKDGILSRPVFETLVTREELKMDELKSELVSLGYLQDNDN